MHVLVVEDEADQARQIEAALHEAGFTVSMASDGEEAMFLGRTIPFDAIVLDAGLPIMDGVYVLSRWREEGMASPVLMLSARDRETDRRAGWTAGCEAYMIKPFAMWELIANLRALIRSFAGQTSARLVCGHVEVDVEQKVVTVDSRRIAIRPKPYQILVYLLHHQGEVIGREQLLDHIYGWNNHPETNTIEVFINDLRRAVGPDILKTRRGFGYVLDCPGNGNSG